MLKLLCLILLATLPAWTNLYAQGPPDSDEGVFNPPAEPDPGLEGLLFEPTIGIPVDGALSLLLGAGILYGIKTLSRRKK